MPNILNLIFGFLFFLMSGIFYIYPDLDIAFSGLFYSQDGGFIYSRNRLVLTIFTFVPRITIAYGLYLFAMASYSYTYRKKTKYHFLYSILLIVLIVGSGLIINLCLKDHFGRARPCSILEFGGDKIFSRVYEISDQCRKNCSFSSGHAAGAFGLTSIMFLMHKRYQTLTFALGLLYGLIVGFCRVLQGGHFISDVFVSGGIVLFLNYIAIIIYDKYFRIQVNVRKKEVWR